MRFRFCAHMLRSFKIFICLLLYKSQRKFCPWKIFNINIIGGFTFLFILTFLSIGNMWNIFEILVDNIFFPKYDFLLESRFLISRCSIYEGKGWHIFITTSGITYFLLEILAGLTQSFFWFFKNFRILFNIISFRKLYIVHRLLMGNIKDMDGTGTLIGNALIETR